MSTPHSVYTFPAVPAEGESDHAKPPRRPQMARAEPLIAPGPRNRRQKLSGLDERSGRQRRRPDEVPCVHDEARLRVERQVPEVAVRRRADVREVRLAVPAERCRDADEDGVALGEVREVASRRSGRAGRPWRRARARCAGCRRHPRAGRAASRDRRRSRRRETRTPRRGARAEGPRTRARSRRRRSRNPNAILGLFDTPAGNVTVASGFAAGTADLVIDVTGWWR